MPVTTRKRGKKWRVIEPNGRLVRNRANTPVDGGGHTSKAKAQRQASAINRKD